jgi:glycosyltransferase involved in cell wall biosynthesis
MITHTARPRILFVSYTAEWTGPTNSLLLLVRHLKNRFDLSVVMPGRGVFQERLAAEGVRPYTLPSLGKAAIPTLARLIRDERVDLVYGNDASGASRNALIAAKLRRVPFICHLRAMARDDDWRGRGFLRFADAAIAVSDACARSHARFARRSAMHVVHNGIDLPDGEPGEGGAARHHLRKVADLPADAFAMVTVGHVGVRKAQQDLARAMARIVEAAPNAYLVVIGRLDREREYTTATRELARSLGVLDRMRFLGLRQDVRRLLEGADLYVHAANADPHPRAVIEAMGAKLAVVSYGVDGITETVLEGRTGHLVTPGSTEELADAVLGLIRDPVRRTEMGSQGRERVLSDFAAETTALRVGGIIDRTLKARSRHGSTSGPGDGSARMRSGTV